MAASPHVVLVTNIPTPYRIPLFNEIHSQLAKRDVRFQVVFGAAGYARRQWKVSLDDVRFPHVVLGGKLLPLQHPESGSFTYYGLGKVLAAEPVSLVVANGFSVATMATCMRSMLQGAPYLIWCGAIGLDGDTDSPFRRWQRRFLVRRASGFIAYGTLAKRYLIRLGADPAAVSIGINTVDTEFFRNVSVETRKPDDVKELICIGDLSARKRVDLLLPVVRNLRKKRKDFLLRLVGTGPEETRLRKLAAQWNIEDCISFEGYKQRPEVATLLGRAECLLFPTGFDIWGLVLVEAMAAGLVCLSSIRAGATADLILDGTTGFALDFENTDAVTTKLAWILDHPEERKRIGHEARRFIREEISISKSASGFVEGIMRGLAQQSGEMTAATRTRSSRHTPGHVL